MNAREEQVKPPEAEKGRSGSDSADPTNGGQVGWGSSDTTKLRQTVAVALSGGLDSMVAALLLKQHGHRVVALNMILGGDDPPEPDEQTQRLASRLGIPLKGVDLREPFHQQVIRPFLQAYSQGRTPNPCVTCNPRIKFTLLMEEAVKLGATKLASGHYARLFCDDNGGRFRLFRARDPRKDQSYFLYGLNQGQLSRTLFPLGGYLKSEVKQLAADAGLSNDHRSESQEICFVPGSDYRRFLEKHLGPSLPKPGPVLDVEGHQVGEHRGIHRFTIGQRRGLRLPSSAPYYVIGIEPETNSVRVGRECDLKRKEVLVTKVTWIAPSPADLPLEALVQVRSRHREAAAILKPTSNGVLVRFLEPQLALTPGQAAVFYSSEEVLGGGTIDRVIS